MRHIDTTQLVSAICNIEIGELRHAIRAHHGRYVFDRPGHHGSVELPVVNYSESFRVVRGMVHSVRILENNTVIVTCYDEHVGGTVDILPNQMFAGELTKITESIPEPDYS